VKWIVRTARKFEKLEAGAHKGQAFLGSPEKETHLKRNALRSTAEDVEEAARLETRQGC
jgi:hypothetical protein